LLGGQARRGVGRRRVGSGGLGAVLGFSEGSAKVLIGVTIWALFDGGEKGLNGVTVLCGESWGRGGGGLGSKRGA
jgi:hypothetical protein